MLAFYVHYIVYLSGCILMFMWFYADWYTSLLKSTASVNCTSLLDNYPVSSNFSGSDRLVILYDLGIGDGKQMTITRAQSPKKNVCLTIVINNHKHVYQMSQKYIMSIALK
jgi:hypothetical protein